MDTVSYTTKGPRNDDAANAAAAGSTRRYRNLQNDQHEDLDPNAEDTRQRLDRGEIAEAADKR